MHHWRRGVIQALSCRESLFSLCFWICSIRSLNSVPPQLLPCWVPLRNHMTFFGAAPFCVRISYHALTLVHNTLLLSPFPNSILLASISFQFRKCWTLHHQRDFSWALILGDSNLLLHPSDLTASHTVSPLSSPKGRLRGSESPSASKHVVKNCSKRRWLICILTPILGFIPQEDVMDC